MPDKYLEIFLHKLNQIKDLNAFFRLLPDKYFTHKSSILLMNWIKSNINTYSIKNCPNFKEDINHFFCIMCQNSKEILITFIDFFSQNLGKDCRNLFIFILNNNDNLNQLMKEKIISFFTNPKNNNLDLIKYFIDNLLKKEMFIINKFLDQIFHLSLSDKDFYSINKTENFKLFEFLLLHKNDFINNKKGIYLDITNKNCKDLLNNIKEGNLSINFINQQKEIIFQSEFTQRIKTLFSYIEEDEKNENKIIEFYNNLIQLFKEWENNIEDLREIENYYVIFFDKNKEKEKEKDKIKKLINDIRKSKLKDLSLKNIITVEFEKNRGLIVDAKEKLHLYKYSLLFKEIYESNKRNIKDQTKLLYESFKNFRHAINIINENPEKIQNNEYIHFFL